MIKVTIEEGMVTHTTVGVQGLPGPMGPEGPAGPAGGDSYVPDPALEDDGRSLEVLTGALVYTTQASKVGHTHTLTDITDSGGAAALNVGTTMGTVAAGDDVRIAPTPVGQSDGRMLAVSSNTLTYVDAPSGGGVETFAALTDTPGAYTGEGEKLVRVNEGETGLEFVEAAAGGATALGDLTDVDPTGASDDDVLTYDTGAWVPSAQRVPDPSGEANDRVLKVAAGALVYGDEGGGASELSDLTDVNTTGASDDDVLTLESGVWVPKAASGGLAEPATFTQEATFEHQITTPPVALGTTGTINLDFAGRAFRTIDVDGDITLTTSNLAPGRAILVKLQGGISQQTIAFPAGWGFVSEKPTVVPKFGACVLSLLSVTSADAGVIASWAQESEEPLDPYVLAFPDNGAILIAVANAETLLLGSVTNLEADGTAGTGTLSFEKNGAAASGTVSMAAGDVLKVTMASSTTPSAVSIPRRTP